MSITELNSKVNEYKELQAMINELNAQAKAIKDLLKAQMVERGTEELNGSVLRRLHEKLTQAKMLQKEDQFFHNGISITLRGGKRNRENH